MTGPKRLKDDPLFLEETGCDLSAEAELVGSYALESAREVVMNEIATSSAGVAVGVQIKGLLGLLAILVGGTGLVWWMQDGPVMDPPTREAVAHVVAAEVSPIETPVREDVKAAVDFAVSESRGPSSQESALQREAEAVRVEADVDPEVTAPEPSEPSTDAVAMVEAPPRARTAIQMGTLASENAVYALIGQQMKAGEYAKARQAMAYSLQQWPEGVHVDGILMTMVECMYRQSKWGEAEKLAELLVDVPGLGHRRTEIVRLRAESLLMLDRCDLAIEVAEEGERSLVAAVKQHCRKAKRNRP